MAVKSSELRSGIFVVLAVLVATILIFSVGNFRARLRSAARYYTYVDNAKFLRSHDPVTYGGFKVGEIKSLDVASDHYGMVRITMDVDEDLPVKDDSVVTVKQDGILGPKYLEISPGTPGAKRVQNNAVIPGVVPAAFVELGPSFEAPLAKLDRLLDNLNLIVGDPDFRKSIPSLLTEARSLLSSLSEQIQKVGTAASKAGEKAQEVFGEVQATVTSSKEPLAKTLKDADELTLHLTKDADQMTEKILKALDEVLGKLSKSADHLDQILRDTDGIIVQNNTNIFETIRSLRDTSHHLELAVKRIRANPSIMLFGAKETPEELRHMDETELRLKGRVRRYGKEEPR